MVVVTRRGEESRNTLRDADLHVVEADEIHPGIVDDLLLNRIGQRDAFCRIERMREVGKRLLYGRIRVMTEVRYALGAQAVTQERIRVTCRAS